ncbi:MAG: YciI family protein [Roseibium sp.]|uniref:YciI family protein n=1 Tax=Roseibium sp. TaxID=1936156 RepID=UPI00262A5ABF|nr:YciI family protein [Roseibium sp.]MCV0426716.1 YciI family protein [Roseibium sp.]
MRSLIILFREPEDPTMLFSVLIYASEDFIDALTPEEHQEIMKKHGAFHEDTKTNKNFAAATKLMSTGTAVTVNKDSDDFVVTDGPFAETKEQFMGFYLLDCANLEEAIDKVKILPLDHGRIEIRPVEYFEGADFTNAERLVINAS